MTLLARIRSFWSALLSRRRIERELAEEWQFHLDARVEALVAQGAPRDEAERRARREFGDPLRWTEQAREARGLGPLQDLGADIRYALRQVRRAPAFAAIVVTTLSLAIGASLAIFALIDRVVLRPVDSPEASRLVVMQRIFDSVGIERRTTAWPWQGYERMLEVDALEAVAASAPAIERLTVSGAGAGPAGGDVLTATFVSTNYFRVFGMAPAAGRDFEASDEQPGVPVVAMLGHRAWRTRFGADAGAIGQDLRIGDTPVTIVGVAPPAYPGLRIGSPEPDLVLLLTAAPHVLTGRFLGVTVGGVRSPVDPLASFTLVGQLRRGARPEQAQAEIASWLGPSERAAVLPLAEGLVPFESRADLILFLTLLAAAVGLTLVIGATNVAGLMLARVEERRSEFAVRAALGAGRLRLARQLGVEVSVLAMAGAAGAVIVAGWVTRGFSAFALPGGIPVDALRSGLDVRTVLFVVLLTAVATFAIVLGPAIGGKHRALADGARRPSGAPRSEARATRVVLGVQLSLCVVLVFGTGLFVRSLSALLSTDLGFEPSGILSVPLAPPPPARQFDSDQWQAAMRFVEQLRDVPGVMSAALGPMPLAQGRDLETAAVEIDGVAADTDVPLDLLFVGPDYFTTLAQRLVRGRDFTTLDAGGTSAVAIVNESAARLFWRDLDPVGRRIGFMPGPIELSVVGVVRDARLDRLEETARPALYVVVASRHPMVSAAFHGMSMARGSVFLMLRTQDAHTAAIAAALPRAAAAAGLSISGVTTIEEAIGGLVMPQRLARALLAGLSVVALLVTLVGVYGFVSGLVVRRTKEIGVRLALGASSSEVLYATLRSTLVLVCAGLAAGGGVAWWVGRFADRFLHGISPSDPASLGIAVLLLGGTAALAALVPALRILRIDPVRVLRAE